MAYLPGKVLTTSLHQRRVAAKRGKAHRGRRWCNDGKIRRVLRLDLHDQRGIRITQWYENVDGNHSVHRLIRRGAQAAVRHQ
jgi:hypothetical protein